MSRVNVEVLRETELAILVTDGVTVEALRVEKGGM